LDKVVITDELEKGHLIVSKGEVEKNGIGIPPDLIIGKIKSVNKSDNKPFQNAEIESLINYSQLEVVFVLIEL